MVMGLGVGAFTAGFFHLTTHAMFKAGLFLGSGSVIHAMHHALHHSGDHKTDAQDIRNMGGLKAKMPLTFWTFVMFTLAISGVPFTSGFLSKDEILAGTLAYANLTGRWYIPIVAFFVAGLTAFYMFRVVILTFLGDHKDLHRYDAIHESPKTMTIPLIVFAILSFFAFFSLNPFNAASGWVYSALPRPESVVPANVAAAGIEEFEASVHQTHVLAMVLSLSMAGLGILMAFLTYYWKKIDADLIAAKTGPLYRFLLNKWKFDELYDATAVAGTIGISKLGRWFDNRIVDGVVNGVGSWTKGLTLGTKRNWVETGISAIFYMIVTAGVSLYVGWVVGFGLMPAEATLGAIVGYVVLGIAVAGFTFFLFYVGVGGYDNSIVDGLVNATAYLAGFLGLLTRRLQTGKVQTYLAFAILGVMILFLWFR
jgi:NADH-quinone oxidoreductase subunit L